jgi:hypothetical protein
MNKKTLLALLVLVLASLACMRQLETWELTPGAITPPVNDLTLYVCVTAEDGAEFRNKQGFIEVIPQDTKIIDSGRRGGPAGNPWAELYYEGESIQVLMSSLGMCADE